MGVGDVIKINVTGECLDAGPYGPKQIDEREVLLNILRTHFLICVLIINRHEIMDPLRIGQFAWFSREGNVLAQVVGNVIGCWVPAGVFKIDEFHILRGREDDVCGEEVVVAEDDGTVVVRLYLHQGILMSDVLWQQVVPFADKRIIDQFLLICNCAAHGNGGLVVKLRQSFRNLCLI